MGTLAGNGLHFFVKYFSENLYLYETAAELDTLLVTSYLII